eukprot:TRINITY_DN5279_c0_g1_i2.p1 TRINITY_DN5279_c0_g1~~TRINITY_DN5279_c0_g1_i2.p1  ORF type:complete len:612 (+),score=127.22 TRINITY_DN5279_c0_g1_i2:189-1838(+)
MNAPEVKEPATPTPTVEHANPSNPVGAGATLSTMFVRERSGQRDDVVRRSAVNSLDANSVGSSGGSQDRPTITRSSSKKRASTGGGGGVDGVQARPRKSVKKTKADFDFGELLGEGSYGKVYHARLKSTNKEYAIKVIERKHILKNDKKKYIMREKQALTAIQHPNLMRLFFAFQDETSLYFVIEYCEGGELMNQVRQGGGKCGLDEARFYTAEIILALEYLREKKIIHRDIKPENILLRANGHIVLTDFGTARLVADEPSADQDTGEIKDRKNSFVGSAEYVSPEILSDNPCGFAADLWSLGCLIYTLLEGRSPFHAGTEYLTFQRILHSEVTYPADFPDTAKDLVSRLLVREPSRRIGAPPRGFDEIKEHPFFDGINFATVNHIAAPVHAKPVDTEPKSHHGRHHSRHLSHLFRDSDKKDNDPKGGKDVNKKWKRFLRASEEIVLCGFVQKRRGLFGKRRMLILSDYPRLVYVDVDKMEKKGEISWSTSLYAELKNQNTFYIHTPTRSYYMQSEDMGAKDWVEEINKPKKNFKEEDSKSTQSTNSRS